ncbi:MAG TPA: hypothetical protein VGW38_01785, partial [Chloroflexota bacterium]|nr:hypothetical protein [Chloroflexota bacterium]
MVVAQVRLFSHASCGWSAAVDVRIRVLPSIVAATAIEPLPRSVREAPFSDTGRRGGTADFEKEQEREIRRSPCPSAKHAQYLAALVVTF